MYYVEEMFSKMNEIVLKIIPTLELKLLNFIRFSTVSHTDVLCTSFISSNPLVLGLFISSTF